MQFGCHRTMETDTNRGRAKRLLYIEVRESLEGFEFG